MSLGGDPAPVRPFTGAGLDRLDGERKDPAYIEDLRRDPAARVVLAGAGGVLIAGDALLRAPLQSTPLEATILLGREGGGRALFAADLDALASEQQERLRAQGTLTGLREAGAELPRAEGGLAAYLASLVGWHRRHGFCPNCGAATEVVEAGFSRHCPGCGAQHFPRTDPVVIMTVSHGDRLLLGRRAGSPKGRMSVLAGFVSPGESAEEAVAREVREESAIEVRDPVFVASQPWPFPSSLMLGFDAACDGGEPRASDAELAEVRWVPVDEVRAALHDDHPGLRLPAAISIARFLIERWVKRHSGD